MSAAPIDVVLGLSAASAGATSRRVRAAYGRATDQAWPDPAVDVAGHLPGANDDAPPADAWAGPGAAQPASNGGFAAEGDRYRSGEPGTRPSAAVHPTRGAGGQTARLARLIARTPPARLALGLAGLLGVVAVQTASFMFVLGDRSSVAETPAFADVTGVARGVPPSDPGALLLALSPPVQAGPGAAAGGAGGQAAARREDSERAGPPVPAPQPTATGMSPGASDRTSAAPAVRVATASALPAAVPGALPAGALATATADGGPDITTFVASPAAMPAAAAGSDPDSTARTASLRREPRPRARPWVTRAVPQRAPAAAPARPLTMAPTAVAVPSTALGPSVTAGANWLQAQPGTHYTLQLVSVTDASNIEGFARRVGAGADVAHLQIRKQGSLRHVLVQGAYAERAEAERRAAGLARRLGVQPWVRSVADVRAELR